MHPPVTGNIDPAAIIAPDTGADIDLAQLARPTALSRSQVKPPARVKSATRCIAQKESDDKERKFAAAVARRAKKPPRRRSRGGLFAEGSSTNKTAAIAGGRFSGAKPLGFANRHRDEEKQSFLAGLAATYSSKP